MGTCNTLRIRHNAGHSKRSVVLVKPGGDNWDTPNLTLSRLPRIALGGSELAGGA
jgi:hypothetical protein